MRNRIASLDTAKGIAILAVILGHYFQEFSPDKRDCEKKSVNKILL